MLFIIIIEVIATFFASCEGSDSYLDKQWNADWGPLPRDASEFSTLLFYLYSSNGYNLTKAELTSFIGCSLGMKACPEVKVNSSFAFLSNCDINVAPTPLQCEVLQKCLNVDDYMRLLDTEMLDVEFFKKIFPAVVYQVNSQNCQKKAANENNKSSRPKPAEVWGYGLLFVTLISACSLAGVSVLPLMAREFYQKLLTALIGLAVGSLAASSLFHLIPQAFKIIALYEGHHHEYLFISASVLFGIWMFFMIERIMKIIILCHEGKRSKMQSSISTQNIVSGSASGSKESIPSHVGNNVHCLNVSSNPNYGLSSNNACGTRDVQLIFASQEQAIKASFGHKQRPLRKNSHSSVEFKQGTDSVIATVAWMIIVGDGFHNFIDGVSIGAAFSESILTGISISLAVMCEELPHELGDFAVLLNAGMSMKQAVMYNFLSATTCYIGLIVGIILGEFTQNSTHIFALAGGMFLYISLVDMVPEMNEVANKASEVGIKEAVKVLFLQNVGIFIGVGSLFILAYYQDYISLN